MTGLTQTVIGAAGFLALGLLCAVTDVPGGALFFGFCAGTFATTAALIHGRAP